MKRLIEKEYFNVANINTIPVRNRLVNAVWTFKRKTKPSGKVYRHRSCLCVDGSRQQEGLNYTHTYSPVVNWSTIRLMFIISIIFKLKSRKVDYIQAFPQAKLEEDVYTRIPAGLYYKEYESVKITL